MAGSRYYSGSATCSDHWVPADAEDTPAKHGLRRILQPKWIALAAGADLVESFGPLPTNIDSKALDAENNRRRLLVFDLCSSEFPEFTEAGSEEDADPIPAKFQSARSVQRMANDRKRANSRSVAPMPKKGTGYARHDESTTPHATNRSFLNSGTASSSGTTAAATHYMDINDVMPGAWVPNQVCSSSTFSPLDRTSLAGIVGASTTSSGLIDHQASSHVSGIATRNRANSGRVTPIVSGDCLGEYKFRASQVTGLWANYSPPSRRDGPTGSDGGGRGSKGSGKGKGYGSSPGASARNAARFVSPAGQQGSREVYIGRPGAADDSSYGRGPSRGTAVGSFAGTNQSRALSRR